MFARKPGLIARCADVSDIQSAIRAASAAGLLTAVRCGGHSLAGFSTCDGGMVIDLSRMRHVTVDPEARRARFAGGCLLGSIDTATQKAGLVFPSGVVSHTGAGGLVLGGGTGWLTRRFGLSCDNVEGLLWSLQTAQIIRADARTRIADLFWALRGGGGNFGVVTEFAVKLHPLNSVVLAEGLCPEPGIRRAAGILARFHGGSSAGFEMEHRSAIGAAFRKSAADLRGRPVAGIRWSGQAILKREKSIFERALALCDRIRCVAGRSLPNSADHGGL